MVDLTELSTAPASASKQPPFREDCWTVEATSTLVDAWGRRYLELNRGNLRGKDWQEVADAVNSLHGLTKKTHRTDVQCKNRIDTLKKKYKVEKVKISDSSGGSAWPFFTRLDFLIRSNTNKHQSMPAPQIPPAEATTPLQPSLLMLPPPPMAVPIPFRKQLTPAIVTSVILPQKRTPPTPAVDESFFWRNYSVMAAAAATYEVEEGEGESEGEGSDGRATEEVEEEEEGVRMLAMAIERFGEIYEKVEHMKQRQMMELEKQKMQFAKDLEVQRMRLFMDTHVQLEKLKQAKRSGSSDIFSLP